jgi:hypothetical protein
LSAYERLSSQCAANTRGAILQCSPPLPSILALSGCCVKSGNLSAVSLGVTNRIPTHDPWLLPDRSVLTADGLLSTPWICATMAGWDVRSENEEGRRGCVERALPCRNRATGRTGKMRPGLGMPCTAETRRPELVRQHGGNEAQQRTQACTESTDGEARLK